MILLTVLDMSPPNKKSARRAARGVGAALCLSEDADERAEGDHHQDEGDQADDADNEETLHQPTDLPSVPASPSGCLSSSVVS